MAKQTTGSRHRDPGYKGIQVKIRDPKTCHFCKSSPIPETAQFCPSCGFPQRGSEAEQKQFILNHRIKKSAHNESQKEISLGRFVLFVLAVLHLAGGIAFQYYYDLPLLTIGLIVIGVIYGGLRLWAQREPYPALLTGLIVYITFIVLSVVAYPASLFTGWFFKGAFIAGLIYGMQAVKKGEQLRRELDVRKASLENPSPAQQGPENPVQPS